MPDKYFILDKSKKQVSKEAKEQAERELRELSVSNDLVRDAMNKDILLGGDTLVHPEGKVIIKINMEGKNWHRFSDGTTIRYERQFDNLNRRQTEAVNAIVVSGEGVPHGTEILIHHNATIDTYEILNYKPTYGTDIKYFSIPQEMCFAWLDGNTWKTLPPYETALRVFKPYTGYLEGIPPTLLKDVLFVTSGELSGKAVMTAKASDYEVVFQNTDGREGKLIRFRPYGDSKTGREEEAIAILEEITEKIHNQEYLIGIELKDAKPFEISAYAD